MKASIRLDDEFIDRVNVAGGSRAAPFIDVRSIPAFGQHHPGPVGDAIASRIRDRRCLDVRSRRAPVAAVDGAKACARRRHLSLVG
jgi:hypothetical protein